MATLTFRQAQLSGAAAVPPAKSEAHRALLLSALGRGACRLTGFPPPLCDDTLAMINGVSALGRTVQAEDRALRVSADTAPGAGFCDVHACAAALRMLIPAFWVRAKNVRFVMDEALFARPLTAFDPLAERLGAGLRRVPGTGGDRPYVALTGRMPAGAYEIDGSLSSQFASGLLIALSHATDAQDRPAASSLRVTAPIVSRPYLDMTVAMMRRFGLPVEEPEEGLFLLPPGDGANPDTVAVSGDWSQAAVLLCLNAMGARIVLNGMDAHGSLQGDARIASILGDMGMAVLSANGSLYADFAPRARLSAIRVDCEDIPDLAPILALTCTQARGTSVLTGVKRLRVKECDRLEATVSLLRRLGARVALEGDDTLTIQGGARLRGGFTADARGDHRMVMLLAAAATLCEEPITVVGVEALSKSWPGFLATYRALGGIAE